MKCLNCGKVIINREGHAKYCGYQCIKEARKKKYPTLSFGGLGTNGKIPTSSVGAIAELMVTQDLLRKGYEIFRAISASCSCDLIALKNKKLFRIEVKTVYPKLDGTYSTLTWLDSSKFDVLAYVCGNTSKIMYQSEFND